MSTAFVTIASFDTPAAAHLALGLLREAGIEAMIRNEQVASVAWEVGFASHGMVEVRVRLADAERAHAIVEEATFHGGVKGADSAAEFTEFAEFTEDEDEPDPRSPEERVDADLSDRAVKCAAFGIVFPPLQLYSLWLLARLWLRGFDRPLRKEVVKQMRDALMMDVVVIIVIALIVSSRV